MKLLMLCRQEEKEADGKPTMAGRLRTSVLSDRLGARATGALVLRARRRRTN